MATKQEKLKSLYQTGFYWSGDIQHSLGIGG